MSLTNFREAAPQWIRTLFLTPSITCETRQIRTRPGLRIIMAPQLMCHVTTIVPDCNPYLLDFFAVFDELTSVQVHFRSKNRDHTPVLVSHHGPPAERLCTQTRGQSGVLENASCIPNPQRLAPSVQSPPSPSSLIVYQALKSWNAHQGAFSNKICVNLGF